MLAHLLGNKMVLSVNMLPLLSFCKLEKALDDFTQKCDAKWSMNKKNPVPLVIKTVTSSRLLGKARKRDLRMPTVEIDLKPDE